MILSDIFKFRKPDGSDPATIAFEIGTNAEIAESVSKNGIALQTNTSTVAYLSDFPLGAYVNAHSFVFIPLYTCTGAVTINFNGLGVKKVFRNGIMQITNGIDFQKGIQYLLTYISPADGGLGAFEALRLSSLGLVQPFTATQNYAADGTIRTLQVNAPLDCQYYELEIGCHLGLCRLKYYTYPTPRMFTSSSYAATFGDVDKVFPFAESNVCYVTQYSQSYFTKTLTFTVTKNTDGFQLSYVQSGDSLETGVLSVLATARKE